VLKEDSFKSEETLDPEDWNSIRALGHQMVDDMLDYLSTVRQRPPMAPCSRRIENSFQKTASARTSICGRNLPRIC